MDVTATKDLLNSAQEEAQGDWNARFSWMLYSVDCDPPALQSLTQDAKHSQFRALDRHRVAVQAYQLFDQPTPLQFVMEPF